MSSGQPSLLRRLVVRLTPQFVENWLGQAGSWFRGGIGRVSDYNRDRLKLRDKVDAAPDMLWTVAKGATSIQHAQAEAAYADAENTRMEAELRRRTLNAKARRESAEADKAEVEVAIARVHEVQARLELAKQLRSLGVNVIIQPSELSLLNLLVESAPSPAIALNARDVIGEEETSTISDRLVDITAQDFRGLEDILTVGPWLCEVGTRVEAGQLLCTVQDGSSPVSVFEIRSPSAGVIFEISAASGTSGAPLRLMARLLVDSGP